MDSPQFSPLVQQALQVITQSDAIFLEHWHKPRHIRHKGVIDLVTETDIAIENFLKEHLHALDPSASILAEESATALVPEGRCWVIDPVDGTTNFAHGVPLTATSVAMWDKGQVEFGIVSAPIMGETYVAERGKGAWLNGSPLHVSDISVCAEALVETGFPYNTRDIMPSLLHDVHALLTHCIGVRRGGSAALDLCWVAAGRFDGYFERGLKPWDVAAGWLMVEEAGGTVSARSGPYVFHGPILATNSLIHAEMQDFLKEKEVETLPQTLHVE